MLLCAFWLSHLHTSGMRELNPDFSLCLQLLIVYGSRYGEWDVDSTASSRIKGALKYTTAFALLVLVLFLVGFFIPVAAQRSGKEHFDLDYFRRLLMENRMIF